MGVRDWLHSIFNKKPSHCILLVEDDPQVRELVRVYLEDAEYQVAMAATAEEVDICLAAAAVPFSCILMDIKLPGANGVQIARGIRKRPGYGRVPILFVSGVFSPSEMEKAVGQLTDTVAINKPFSRSQLLSAISSMIPGEPPRQHPHARRGRPGPVPAK